MCLSKQLLQVLFQTTLPERTNGIVPEILARDAEATDGFAQFQKQKSIHLAVDEKWLVIPPSGIVGGVIVPYFSPAVEDRHFEILEVEHVLRTIDHVDI